MKEVLLLLGALLATCLAAPLRESSDVLIEGRATADVKFYLYTKSNPSKPQQLTINNADSVNKSNFNTNLQTKIIIHGWSNNYTTSPNPAIREAYFSQKDDFNIISVDWSAYANLNYVLSKAKVPLVGENVAELVDYLNSKFGLSFDKLVVIGHSLGAHVAGFCGKNVKRGKLVAIVGLDPAYPLYSYYNTTARLASTDAKYVETIQTNGYLKGFLKPIGSAAFYPNWGRIQPGCGIDLDGTCSHARSVSYYAEAVRGYKYSPIYKCSSFTNISEKSGCNTEQNNVEIGDPLQITRTNGIFYFKTNDKAPFGHK